MITNSAAQLKSVYNAKARVAEQVVLVLNRKKQASKFVHCNGYLPEPVSAIKEFMDTELKEIAVFNAAVATVSHRQALQEILNLIDP